MDGCMDGWMDGWMSGRKHQNNIHTGRDLTGHQPNAPIPLFWQRRKQTE